MTADRDALIAFLRERDVMGDLVETVAEIIAERDDLQRRIEAIDTVKLEQIAEHLDFCDGLMEDQIRSSQVPIDHPKVAKALSVLAGGEMQDDLRSWARILKGDTDG